MAKIEWRGKSVEELKAMSLNDFAKLVTARERRALKRGWTAEEQILIEKIRTKPGKFHRTRCREMVIVPEMLGAKIGVHNGKEYKAVEIKPYMLGHRLGEFVLTRKEVKHSAPGFGATKSSKYIPLK
jgi:small subunit ribosomal protein S19